jgi:hypothetical protein
VKSGSSAMPRSSRAASFNASLLLGEVQFCHALAHCGFAHSKASGRCSVRALFGKNRQPVQMRPKAFNRLRVHVLFVHH